MVSTMRISDIYNRETKSLLVQVLSSRCALILGRSRVKAPTSFDWHAAADLAASTVMERKITLLQRSGRSWRTRPFSTDVVG